MAANRLELFVTILHVASIIQAAFGKKGVCCSNPCGSGTCQVASKKSITYYCACLPNYIAGTLNGSVTCIAQKNYNGTAVNTGLVPAATPIWGTSSTNSFFRHISVGYLSEGGQNPNWNYTSKWNWAAIGAVSPVKDQLGCQACSAFATTAAIESLVYILNPSIGVPPNISVQQFLDCGADSCSGGWLTTVLSYAASNHLATASVNPYLAVEDSNCCNRSSGEYSIAMFEEVSSYGWFGRMLAVQQQPIIAAVEAAGTFFQTYTSGIFDDPTCYKNGLDHLVLIVGYDLTASTPYWIIKNSWGTKWGENGYMRLAIASGSGICGINVLPAYFPVLNVSSAPSLSDPCFSLSYGRQNGVTPGYQNPCGSGVCTPTGPETYTCTCPSPFTAVKNVDGSSSCSPGSPCSFFDKNPCGIGSCIDSTTTPGYYACICPFGYDDGTIASTGNPTCVPASVSSGPHIYTVPPSYSVTCPLVYATYGMSKSAFLTQNPNVRCFTSQGDPVRLPCWTVLNVTNDMGSCSVPYAVNLGDTCTSIKNRFSPQLTTNVTGPGSPNPDLACSDLLPGQMICIERNATMADSIICTLQYDLQENDSCDSLIQTYFNGSALPFFKYNPGIYCSHLNPTKRQLIVSIGQVCLKADPFRTTLAGCSTGRYYTVKSGDTCARVISYVYGGSALRFYNLNRFTCADKLLYVGRVLCAP